MSRGQFIGYGKLLNAPNVLSLHPFGMFQDFNLPEDEPQVISLFTAQDFPQISPIQKKEVLDFLNQFSDIFAKDSTDYSLAKGIIHQINTGDAPPSTLNHIAAVVWRTHRCLKSSNNC
ncbi:hypothetical protein DSO57_1033170 [Entomophthora muscae]|uniref:Uncharacterized protein n=1 Tax=Entomophthora muscae TaxID=34485 RepID=A0ACC2U962_9FUNG|nr:hypothetical protein DSO57_1033170 [Entomophthora muscae]